MFRISLAAAIFLASLALANAQSSSASYKAVDFVNPEANISSSSGYKLNDSIDYYGGVNASPGYTECTGDFAVLSACGGTVTPPPPPPPAGGGGGGGSGSINWGTPACSLTGDCPEGPTVPEVVEKPPVKKPFKLPDIKEPATPVEPVTEIEEPAPVSQLTEQQQQQIVQQVQAVGQQVGAEILKAVAPEICEDLTCSEVNLFRPAAPGRRLGAEGAVCRIYTFGGYQITVSCQDALLVWLAIILLTIAPFPLGILVWRKKKVKKMKLVKVKVRQDWDR